MNKNKILRYFIYLIFCALIIIIGVALTFYLNTIDDIDNNNDNVYDNDKINWKFGLNENANSYDCYDKDNDNYNYYDNEYDFDYDNGSFICIGELFLKFFIAFLAGSIFSDKYFIKIGTI
jgi:hypothetical protein